MKKISYETKTIIYALLVFVAVVGFGFAFFTGLDWLEARSEERLPKPYQEAYQEGDLNVTCDYGADGKLLIKTTYNKNTKITTTYTYLYTSNGWGTTLTGVQVITVDENGAIINCSEKE